jgi:PAS domain-containing protein
MNYLTSPIAVRLVVFVVGFLMVICCVALGYAVVRLRRSIANEDESQTPRSVLSPDSLAFAAFQQTIAELKQREREFELKMRAEKERANSAEALTRSLLENLPVPAIFFNRVGLVRQANPAARALFGYLSPAGLSVNNLFDSAIFDMPHNDETPSVSVSEVLRDAFRNDAPLQNLHVSYVDRNATATLLELTVLPQNGGGVVLVRPIDAVGACTSEVLPTAESTPSTPGKAE